MDLISPADSPFFIYFFQLSEFGNVKLFQCNPNDARAQYRSIRLPRRPQKSSVPLCLPFGIVGAAINSVAFYHPLAGGHVNAVEGGTTEGFDICGGHADPTESYHYHKIPEKHLDPKERNSNLHAPEHDQCPYTVGEVDKMIGMIFYNFNPLKTFWCHFVD